jgi:type IV pilus assembly protein PilQ
MMRTRVTGLLAFAAVLLAGNGLAQTPDASPPFRGITVSELPHETGADRRGLDAPLARAEWTAGAVLMPHPAATPTAPSRVAQAAPSGAQGTPPSPGRQAQLQTTSNGSKLITLDFKDAEVVNVLRLLAAEAGRNIVVGDDVKGKISVSLRNVTWDQALDTILEARGLQKVEKAGIIRIVSSEQLAKEREAQAKADEAKRKAEIEIRTKMAEAQIKEEEVAARRAAAEAARAEAEARGPIREEMIPLRYADAEEVARTIGGILGVRVVQGGFSAPVPLPQLSSLYVPTPPVEIPSAPPPPVTVPGQEPTPSTESVAQGLTVGFYKKTNAVFLRYYARDLERINKLIRDYLDIPVPQIQIAAQMVITTLNNLEQIGVQWGGAGAVNVGGTKVFVGQGFAVPAPVAPGTKPADVPTNTGGTPLPPTSPSTVGNIVNLPTSLLPTLLGATPAGGILLGIIGSNFNINMAIQALEVQGKARTLAAPKAVTVENATATISRGLQVPFTSTPTSGVSQVQFKDALMKLEVTPRLIRGDGEQRIKMKVVFDNDQPDFSQSVLGNPSIFKRHQDTEVVIREGQRLVIGGVTNDQSSNTERSVPGISRIPVLGYLFKSRENNASGEELIVIITPTVLTDASAPPKR